MDIKDIKQLAKVLNESELSAIEVCEGNNKIRLEKSFVLEQPVQISHKRPQIKEEIEPPPAANQPTASEVNFNNLTEVKSPMIGIFYASPSPGEKPFVEIGKKIKKGDTLCIIEAMKVMNEITAEDDGEIVDVCVQNGQLVEFSQVLFKIF